MVALQQAAEGVAFTSPRVLPLLVLTPSFLVGFLAWQWFTTRKYQKVDSIVSWDIVRNRAFMAMLGLVRTQTLCRQKLTNTRSNAWLSGMAMVVTVVQIPQRYMLVNHLSPINAGMRLLPFVAVIAFTSVFIAIFVSKAKIPAVYALILGAFIQVSGIAGLSQTSVSPPIEASQYGFQVLADAGVGTYKIILILLTPYVVDKRDLGELATSMFCH